MRKLLALILLAGTAAPALAAGDPGDHQGRHRESGTQSASEDRGGRANAHVDRGNRVGNDGGSQSQPHAEATHVEATHVIGSGGGNSGEHRSHFEFRGRSGGGDQPAAQVESNNGNGGQAGEPRFHHGVVNRISSGDQSADQPTRHDTLRSTIGNVRSGDSTPNRGPKIVEAPQDHTVTDLREQRRAVPAVFRNRVPIVSNTPHEGTQPPRRIESRRSHNWVDWSTSSWRHDHKYDWKDHRRRHRSLFHLGFYYDPFGWGYRPYQLGWRLWPSYYSNNFWINDPYQYRLPYAPPGYRWIRYYDDAILVDTWDGRVVDVIYNFFW